MNIEHYRETAARHGLRSAALELVYRAVNRVADVKVLQGIYITTAMLAPETRDGECSLASRFVERDRLVELCRDERTGMSPEFAAAAADKGDLCYGFFDGEVLASYGWYSTRATAMSKTLEVLFDPAWAYMYKGYTQPAYRGQRLHGLGMARALLALTERGRAGLVSYVDATNFPSLKSCYRMGYRDFGEIVIFTAAGHPISIASPGCRPYGFRVVSK